MKTLKLNIKKGFNYSIYSLLSVFLLLLGVLVYLKIRFPKNTGLFFQEGKFRAFGILKTTENSNEILGNWFIPGILSLLVVFIIITGKNIK